jgi:hypothetical protein
MALPNRMFLHPGLLWPDYCVYHEIIYLSFFLILHTP